MALMLQGPAGFPHLTASPHLQFQEMRVPFPPKSIAMLRARPQTTPH